MLRITADELPRFMICNGSRNMPMSHPPSVEDTATRDEGIAAHYMATQAHNGRSSLDELIDRKASNGVFMTAEMAEHVYSYIITLEQDGWMEYDTTHDNNPYWLLPGRTDYVRGSPKVLRVCDFKYGYRIVEPEHNWTLISHALGYLKQMPGAPERIDLQIFQPRAYHADGPLRTWSVSYAELTTYFAQLDYTLKNPADALRTSNFCGKCRALTTCPAARAAEMNSIDMSDVVYNDTINNDELAFMLENLNRAETMIEQRKKAFEELAKYRIASGQVIENYMVEIGLGHSKWNEGITSALLKAITGKDLSIEKLPTPAEAKRRGVNESVIKALSYRPRTSEKLKRVDANKKASKMFGNLTEGK